MRVRGRAVVWCTSFRFVETNWAGAAQEIVVRARQRVLDGDLRCLCLRYAALKFFAVALQHDPAGRRVVGGEHRSEFVQAESDLPAVHDDRDAGEVFVGVAPPAVDPPRRVQEADRFPVPQNVGGETEVGGELADRELGLGLDFMLT